MPVGIHRIVLNPDVKAEDFERFMTEELFPAARTVISIRIGRVDVHYTLVRRKTRKGQAGGREYRWIIEVDQEAIGSFPTDVGKELKSKLDSFGTRTFGGFTVVGKSSNTISTPTGTFDDPAGDPSGWVG